MAAAASLKTHRPRPVRLGAALLALFGAGAAAAATSIPPGLWHNRSYGELLRVSQHDFELFEITRISCISRGVDLIRQRVG